MKISQQEVTPKKRIIIAIKQSETEIALLKKSLGGRDDLLIIASPTFDENTLQILRGKVSGVTRFDIWVHGGVKNEEHTFQTRPGKVLPTRILFSRLRKIVGEETPLTNVNLWSCLGGAAAKDVKELGVSSTLICHADENFDILTKTALNEIIAAETQTGRESFLDSFLRSPETVTFSHCRAGGEVVKHTARRSGRAITVDDELSRHLEEEFKKFSSFLTEAGLPTNDLLAAHLSAETIKKYQEEDIVISSIRNDPKRMQEYLLAKDSSGNKKFNLDEIKIARMISYAEKNGHKQSFKILIDYMVNFDYRDADGLTALMRASNIGYTDIVEKIISSGADVNIKNGNGVTALMFASLNGHTDIVKKIISSGADVNIKDGNGVTALMFASQNGHTDIVKELISSGADVNIKNGNGSKALTIAATMNHAQSVQVLIDNGADVDSKDNLGTTALMDASYKGYTDIVRKLISSEADVNIGDGNGATALMRALSAGHEDVVNELIAGGARVNIADGEKYAALSMATAQNLAESVEMLIKHGANVNFRDNDGNTALILASRNGNADIVKKLLSGGADVSIAGNNGMTALSYVLKRGDKDPIYEMLKASLNTPRVNTEQDLFPSKSSSIEVAPIKSITAKKDPIYEATNPPLDEAEVDTKEHRSASQSSSIFAPSTSMTAMTVTALFAVGLAVLFMWRRKGRYADPETRPNSQVNKPIAKKTEERVRNKGKTS